MKTLMSRGMKVSRPKTKKNWFVGWWQRVDEGFGVVLEITKTAKGYTIRAFDNYDNEELIVSKTNWDGNVLRFETYVPSTKHRTKNCLSLVSRTKLIQELTFWENWKKVATPLQSQKGKGASGQNGKVTGRAITKN
jgi:hypothetical protein